MKVCVISKTSDRVPEGQVFLTIGNEYEVYAMSMFAGYLYLQVINDLNLVDWIPAELTEMTDMTLPPDWIFNLLNSGNLMFVLGPRFIAESESDYTQMVELEHPKMIHFYERLKAIDQATNDEIGSENDS